MKKTKAPLFLARETLIYCLGAERMPTGSGTPSSPYTACPSDQQDTTAFKTWECP